MSDRPRADGPDARATGHRGVLRPRRVIAAVLVLGLLGGATGAWWGGRQATVKEATAVILLNPLQGNPFSPDARGDDLVNLETEAQLVTSDAVLNRLAAALPNGPAVSPDDVTVTVPTNTQLLSISVAEASAAQAARVTQELATLYLDYRRSRTESSLFNQRANINEQIDQRLTERAAMITRLDDLEPRSPGSTLLVQQILAVVTQISELRTQLGEVGSVSLDPGQLVTPARASARGLLPPGPWPPAGIGLALGVLCGVVAATQLSSRRDAVRTRDDLAVLDVTCWGTLPTEPDPGAAARLRAVLLAARQEPQALVLVCRSGSTTAVGPPPPRATTARLADSFAAAHLRTVLVDLAGQHGTRGHRGQPGLTDVLHDQIALPAALTWDGDLGVLPSGRQRRELDDLAATPAMSELLLQLRDCADVVLLSAGPPSSPPAQALAAAVDLVVLEVPAGTVTSDVVRQDVEELTTAGARRVGAVLVTGTEGRPTSGSSLVAGSAEDPAGHASGRDRRDVLSRLVPWVHGRLVHGTRRLARVAARDAATPSVRPQERV